MPVQRGQDSRGSFYRWGNQTSSAKAKKYYYTPGNKKSRNAAKNKAIDQGMAIYYNEAKRNANGGNIFEDIGNKINSTLASFVSKDAPKEIKNLLEKHGSARITKIQVCREPVQKAVTSILNALSLGKFNKNKEKLGYDQVFHLYMYMQLSDGYSFRIEKNEVVKLTKSNGSKEGECQPVYLNSTSKVTLGELFDKSIKKHKDFWLYSAYSNNCQKFIYDLLNDSGLSNPALNKFIKQDADKLFENLPEYTKTVADISTNTAGIGRRLLDFFK